jgi:hypothetical protein
LRGKLFLSPGDDDMFAPGDIAGQLDREPSFQILLAITITTSLSRVLLGTGAGPADQDVHCSNIPYKDLRMKIAGFHETF